MIYILIMMLFILFASHVYIIQIMYTNEHSLFKLFVFGQRQFNAKYYFLTYVGKHFFFIYFDVSIIIIDNELKTEFGNFSYNSKRYLPIEIERMYVFRYYNER